MLKNTQGCQIERSQPSRGRESSRFAVSTSRDTTSSDHTSACVLRRMSQVGMSMRNKAPNGRSRRAERPAEARKRADRCSVRARPASTHEDAPGESPELPARSSRRPVLVGEVVLVRDGTSYWWSGMPNSQAQPPTNPRNGGLFHATAAAKPDCAGAGSGERHAETKNAFLKRPHTSLSQHRAAARRGGSPPHDDPSPSGRAPRHGAGIRPSSDGQHVSSGHIRARLAPVLYRSSFVVVVSGQWGERTAIRVTTAVSSLLKLCLLVWRNPGKPRGSLQHADEITKL